MLKIIQNKIVYLQIIYINFFIKIENKTENHILLFIFSFEEIYINGNKN